MKRLTTPTLIAIISLVVVIFHNCTDHALEDTQDNSSFGLIQTKVFNTSCAISGCHASKDDAGYVQHKLVLAQGVAYNNLVNADPENENARLDGLKRVLAGDAEKSLLLHKIHCDAGHHLHDYGNLMPIGKDPLSQGQIDFIKSWIEEGAPEKGLIQADPELLNDNVPNCEENFEPLASPADGTGYQIKIAPFNVHPNFEREIFVYKEVGNTEAVYINKIEMKMRQNSHHFLVNTFSPQTPATLLPPINTIRDLRDSNGKLILPTVAQMEYQIFTIASQSPTLDYTFPSGVALKIPAQHKLDVNLHYVNKSTGSIQGECYLNIYKANPTEVLREAQPIFYSNTSISLPPNEKTIVTKTFTAKAPMKIFMLTSHSHKHGERFEIQIKGGARDGEIIYTSTDWHHPALKTYETPIELNTNEGLTMIVLYNNTTSKTINFGLTSEDEMAIIYGYYY
jgi:hypothetical protein